VETLRCGYDPLDARAERMTQGHYTWKLNDAFPMISFTLIDAFMEPNACFYAIKRAYAPVLAVIEAGDHIYLRGVNDTAKQVCGTLRFKSLNRFTNSVLTAFEVPIFLFPGESKVFMNLDRFRFGREEVLYCEIEDQDGNILCRNIQELDIERNSIFPEATISLRQCGDDIIVTTDQYARYVELCGDDNGDAFGWYFEDNYFDLLPFEERRIHVGGTHQAGTISAKAHYSPNKTTLSFQRGK